MEEAGSSGSLPLYGLLEMDRPGNLWVERYEVPWATGPQHWDVFDRSGVPIATVEIPEVAIPRCARDPHLDHTCDYILDIGPDYILLRVVDELGVQGVALHRLVK